MSKEESIEWYTIFGPTTEYPIKCRTIEDVIDWFDLWGPYQINPDPEDYETWEFSGGWFLEYNDGSHMDKVTWNSLETHKR